MKSTRATGWALAYFALSTVVLVAPVYTTFGNRIEPRVLGLPWSLVWVLLVIAANCGVLALLYVRRSIDHAELEDEASGTR
ncbi:MAG: hypothetical protein IAG13_13480 [Deltaproteobacteria bacterium]|nr:hypothetical protein [Nannocystaceae bacterium]